MLAEAILPVPGWSFAASHGELDSGSLALASPKGGLHLHGSARDLSSPDLRVRGPPIAS